MCSDATDVTDVCLPGMLVKSSVYMGNGRRPCVFGTWISGVGCPYSQRRRIISIDSQSFPSAATHRFDTRAAEVAREKPGKELVLDQNKISMKDRSDKGRCAIQDTLSLHQALQRRALACDLMSACSYEVLHEWHSFMLERLQQSPPPNCAKLTVEHLLRADRAAWVRLSEKVHTLKPNASGVLPLDAAIADLNRDPTVLFHLLNVREVRTVEAPRVPPKKEDKFAKLDNKRKQEELKKNKQDPNKSQKAELPDELKAIPGLNLTTAEGEKFCWPYNCAKGCRFAKAGKACRRGKHACMKCGKNHSLQECKE